MSLSIATTTPDERRSVRRVLSPRPKLRLDEWWRRLDTTADGLSEQVAYERLMKCGLNRLEQRHGNAFTQFFSTFWGSLAWMIEIAAVFAILSHDMTAFVAVLVVLLAAVIAGFRQEVQFAAAAEELKKRLAPKARVKRAGNWREIDAAHLAPGDVIRLRPGDIIPADVVFVMGKELRIDQSTLSGGSRPVEKRAQEIGYAGCVVERGEMDALVTHTGCHTYLGKKRRLAPSAEDASRLRTSAPTIGNYVIYSSLALAGVLFLVTLLRGASGPTILEFALILLVAAIPAGMPVVLGVASTMWGRLRSKTKTSLTRLA